VTKTEKKITMNGRKTGKLRTMPKTVRIVEFYLRELMVVIGSSARFALTNFVGLVLSHMITIWPLTSMVPVLKQLVMSLTIIITIIIIITIKPITSTPTINVEEE